MTTGLATKAIAKNYRGIDFEVFQEAGKWCVMSKHFYFKGDEDTSMGFMINKAKAAIDLLISGRKTKF